MTSFQERTKAIILSCISVTQLLHVSVFTQKKNQPLRPFEKEIFSHSMDFLRSLLGLITQPTLKGVAPAGNLNYIFMGQNMSELQNNLGELSMRQKLFKTAKPYRP